MWSPTKLLTVLPITRALEHKVMLTAACAINEADIAAKPPNFVCTVATTARHLAAYRTMSAALPG